MAYDNFIHSKNNKGGLPAMQGRNEFLSMLGDESDTASSTSSHYASDHDMFDDLTSWEGNWTS